MAILGYWQFFATPVLTYGALKVELLNRIVQSREKRMRRIYRQDNATEAMLDVIERPVLVVPEGDQVFRPLDSFESSFLRFPIPSE